MKVTMVGLHKIVNASARRRLLRTSVQVLARWQTPQVHIDSNACVTRFLHMIGYRTPQIMIPPDSIAAGVA